MERISYLFKDFYQILFYKGMNSSCRTRIFFKYTIIDERIKIMINSIFLFFYLNKKKRKN